MQLTFRSLLPRLCSALAFAGLWATVRGRNRPDINYNTDESRAIGTCCILSVTESSYPEIRGGWRVVHVNSSATFNVGGIYKSMLIGYDEERGKWVSYTEDFDEKQMTYDTSKNGEIVNSNLTVRLVNKAWYAVCMYPTDKPQLRLFSCPYYFDASDKSDARKTQAPPAPQAEIKKYELDQRKLWFLRAIASVTLFILIIVSLCFIKKKK
ncbi:hypothetical protein PAPHI01_0137 [Pancytospora philotis]|nr:hypothetical protein PAPHI01_0137 [Pancytospora philotis]